MVFLALAVRTQAPIDRDTLVAVVELFAFQPVIKVTPRRVLADGRAEMVLRLVEIEVVVLVEQNRLAVVAGNLPAPARQGGKAVRLGNSVPVQQQKIRDASDVFPRNGPAAIGCADQQTPPVPRGPLDALDQFVDAVRLQNRVVVTHVAFVVDFDEHVAITAVEQPVRCVVRRANHCRFIAQPFVLTEIEAAEDDGQAEFVRLVENAPKPIQIIRPQRTVRFNGGIVPRLFLRVTLRRPALQIDGEREQAVPAPFRHRGNELARVPFRVPFARVRVSPLVRGGRIAVVENSLDHPRVQQQPLDAVPAPDATGISWPAVDVKFVANDGDGGFLRRRPVRLAAPPAKRHGEKRDGN